MSNAQQEANLADDDAREYPARRVRKPIRDETSERDDDDR